MRRRYFLKALGLSPVICLPKIASSKIKSDKEWFFIDYKHNAGFINRLVWYGVLDDGEQLCKDFFAKALSEKPSKFDYEEGLE